MNDIIQSNSQSTITSLDLVKEINMFREQEGGRTKLKHADLLKVIRDEFEDEIQEGKISSLLITNELPNNGTRKTPMFELTYSQAKQVLVRESKFVRKAVIAYIEKLENALKPQLPSNYIEALKALVKSEEEKEKLALENKKQAKEIERKDQSLQHKTEVIEGLVEEIPLADMRQRINQIVRKGGVSEINRWWRLLYDEFNRKYHINIYTRMNNCEYSGSRLDYVEKELHMIPELYDLTCKLFENSYEDLMKSWAKNAKRAARYRNN